MGGIPPINLADDGAAPSPAEMAARLAALTADGSVSTDYYGAGGPVTALEQAFATLLGKERAVMFPTGTLANRVAAQLMAAGRSGPRLIVHRDSHFFNDAGDNITAAGVTMVPLAGEGPSFTAAQVKAEMARTASARVKACLAGIAIESPSRRLANRLFDLEQRRDIVALARAEGLPLYLDAARLFIEAAWTGQSPAGIAGPYDYVYVSLYKYLDAPFGSMLAGPAAALDEIFHERRRLGGGLYQMWPAALLALDALPRQTHDWAKARSAGEAVLDTLAAVGLPVTRFADGSNTALVRLGEGHAGLAGLVERGKATGLKVAPPSQDAVTLKINASWIREAPEALAVRIVTLLRG